MRQRAERRGSAGALLALIVFRAAGKASVDGHADVLWAAAAVGSVTFGLMLPWTRAHLGAAVLLAAVAGMTKSEGTFTAACIIVLIGIRGVLVARSRTTRPAHVAHVRAYIQPVAFAFGSLVLVGLWPVVVRLLHALPNVEFSGKRVGTNAAA